MWFVSDIESHFHKCRSRVDVFGVFFFIKFIEKEKEEKNREQDEILRIKYSKLENVTDVESYIKSINSKKVEKKDKVEDFYKEVENNNDLYQTNKKTKSYQQKRLPSWHIYG